MGEKDGHYFASREQRERAMSREAPDGNAAAAHAEMADRYEALAAVFVHSFPTRRSSDLKSVV